MILDHLANRRVRRVGELVHQAAFRVGLLRLERSISEKMAFAKPGELPGPAALVNARPIIAVVSEFFKRNRLSTILDQTNPLSEIDNLRRLSVMGPGGVTKERASFSMRDINSSQYSGFVQVRSRKDLISGWLLIWLFTPESIGMVLWKLLIEKC